MQFTGEGHVLKHGALLGFPFVILPTLGIPTLLDVLQNKPCFLAILTAPQAIVLKMMPNLILAVAGINALSSDYHHDDCNCESPTTTRYDVYRGS